MRTVTGGERTLLASAHEIHLIVEVANASGTLIDVSRYVDFDTGVTVSASIDDPVQKATVNFIREDGVDSLAPMMVGSTLNRDNASVYAPLLASNRQIVISTAVVSPGATVTGFKIVFIGFIDSVSWETTPVRVVCRDLGKALLDRFIEQERPYGSTVLPGTAVETIMAQILADNVTSPPSVVLPSGSPGYNFLAYSQAQVNVLEALRTLASRFGWDIRYKWNGSAFNLSLFPVSRSKTTPDATFGPSEYLDITAIVEDDTNIRNVVEGYFADSANNGTVTRVVQTDPASIAKYGRRYMFIGEDPKDGIDTAAEMGAFLTAILSDVASPKVDHTFVTTYFWPAELADLYRFSPNGVHYDTNLDLAVVEWSHTLSKGGGTTTIGLRGKPAGANNWWLDQAIDPDVDLNPDIRWMNTPVPIYDGANVVGWRVSGAVDEDTNAVVITVNGGVTVDTTFPNFVLSTLAGFNEYWIDVSAVPGTAKQFTVLLSQSDGAIGSVIIEPRQLFNPTAAIPRPGEVGSSLVQILSRAPNTVSNVTRVSATLFSITLSVSPVNSSILYRFDPVTGLEPWVTVQSAAGNVVIGKGTSAEPYIDVSATSRVLEYRGVSSSGVSEDVHRLVLDKESVPTIDISILETIANVLTIGWTVNDDVVRVQISARRNGDPRIPDLAPNGAYVKYDGTSQGSSVQFRADGTSIDGDVWTIVARAYDMFGDYAEVVKDYNIAGAAVASGLSNLQVVPTVSGGGTRFVRVNWATSPSIIAAPASYKVRALANGQEFVSLASNTSPYNDTDSIPPNGYVDHNSAPWDWIVDFGTPSETRTYFYTIELYTSGNVLIATYNISYTGPFVPGQGYLDPSPTAAPPTPVISASSFPLQYVNITVSGADSRYSTELEVRQNAANATGGTLVETIRLNAGNVVCRSQNVDGNFYYSVRARYRQGAATGPFSTYSNVVLVSNGGLV